MESEKIRWMLTSPGVVVTSVVRSLPEMDEWWALNLNLNGILKIRPPSEKGDYETFKVP